MLAKVALGVTSMTSVAAGTCAYRLFRQSRTDPLTGLGNRAALIAAFNRAMKRGRGLVGVAIGDMNGFKAINDVHGHRFGDQILIAVATKLRDTTHRGEIPVRLHGDEFAILLRRVETPEQAERRVRALQAAVATITELDGQPVDVGILLGVMTAPAAKAQLSALLASADDRMYADKHTTRQHLTDRMTAAA